MTAIRTPEDERPTAVYRDSPNPFPHRQDTVYERERSKDRPVLYDAKGEPLTWKRQPLGFQPPKERDR